MMSARGLAWGVVVCVPCILHLCIRNISNVSWGRSLCNWQTQQAWLEREVPMVLEWCCSGRSRLMSETWKKDREDIHHLLRSVQVKSWTKHDNPDHWAATEADPGWAEMHALQHQSGKRPVFLLLHDLAPFLEAVARALPLFCVVWNMLVLEKPTNGSKSSLRGRGQEH